MGAPRTVGRRSWLVCLFAVFLAALPACSLIYDADVFRLPDADLTPDADTSPCAELGTPALSLLEIAPRAVDEGEGCAWTGDACDATARGVPVVIHGCNIAADAAISLVGLDVEVAPPVIATNGRMLAFSLAVPVRGDRGQGMSDTVMVQVAQGDQVEELGLTVRWLDEFVATQRVPESGTYDLDATGNALAARYSRIHIDRDVRLAGTQPARFVATAEIELAAAVIADGETPGNGSEQGGKAGPGGCDGGNRQGAGGCGPSGGIGGGSDPLEAGSGGGGGGHAEDGTTGDGGDGSTSLGGKPGGIPTLAPLLGRLGDDRTASRGHGGGGGGNGTLGAGGPGGGGGGVIEMTSLGRLTLSSDTARLSARGGDGAQGLCATGGGNGGGGSGGAILVRAAQALSDEPVAAQTWIDVAGGAGADNACHKGGDGSPGRARVDIPAAAPLPAGLRLIPHLYRGPMLSPDLLAITRTRRVTVAIIGAIGATYWWQVQGGEPVPVSLQDAEATNIEVELAPGLNQICALVASDITPAQPEGRNCSSIAYIP